MALIECKECGGKMSDQADACPHCGWPNEVKKAERLRKIDEENHRKAAAMGLTYEEYLKYILKTVTDKMERDKNGPFIHFGY